MRGPVFLARVSRAVKASTRWRSHAGKRPSDHFKTLPYCAMERAYASNLSPADQCMEFGPLGRGPLAASKRRQATRLIEIVSQHSSPIALRMEAKVPEKPRRRLEPPIVSSLIGVCCRSFACYANGSWQGPQEKRLWWLKRR